MGKNKTNFLVQGSILAFAGILVRVIGIIYRVPVQNILANGLLDIDFMVGHGETRARSDPLTA